MTLAGVCLAIVAQSGVVPWQGHFMAIGGDLWPWRAAQVQAESGFRLEAKSPVGARGPAQFMPSTWSWCQQRGWVRPGDQPEDLLPALVAQHRYMLWIAARVEGDRDATTASYNCGLGNVLKAKRLATELGLPGSGTWLQVLPRVTGHHAKETQDYVARIRRFERHITTRWEGTR